MSFSDLGYFDNMLVGDEKLRRIKHDWMVKIMDAAVALGVKAVCGFVGRNISLDMDQNLEDFERSFVPLLKAAKDRGLEYRVEQCPMPGWNTTDLWHNKIGYTPGMWIRLHRIAEKHKVRRPAPHPLRPVPRDPDGPEHARHLPVPEGRGLQLPDRRLPREGPGHQPQGRGGVGLRRARRWSAATARTASPIPTSASSRRPGSSRSSWPRTSCPGTARHDPLAYLQNRTVDWLDHQLAARELLKFKNGVSQRRPRGRARVPGRPHPGPAEAGPDPEGLDRLHARDRRGRRRTCSRCTACWRARASRSRASGARPTGAENTNARGGRPRAFDYVWRALLKRW